jgi:hypothetical protein
LEPFSEELDWRLGIIPSESIALFAEFTSPITGLDGHGESRGCPGSLLFSYQGEIARSQNGARIAGNHALLAAASEQFADCLSDVWASVKEQVRQIAEVDLGDLVEETAGAVEKEQPSKVFLKTLGELFAVHMVWVDTADGRKESRSRAALVGKIADPKIPYISHAKDDTAINLSIPPALAAVQDSLRRQGRPPLNVSERTLITQLTADGLLLDEDNEPLDKNDKGVKTKQYRIDGERSRCVRIRIGEICESRMLMIPKED